MESDKRNFESVFSKKVRAGRRRTYFFDVRTTRSNDYYITITESKRKFDEDGYERHKLFLYKEDFNKFIEGLDATVGHIKTELMPEYDFDEFSRPLEDGQPYGGHKDVSTNADSDSEETKVEEVSETTEEVVETLEEEVVDALHDEAESEETPTEETSNEETPTEEEETPQPAEDPIDEEDLKWD